jgi:uncharacterized Zn finger protein
MSWREWQDWEYAGPRRPANGIKARTQRGKFGATWWAGRWLAALEQLVDAGRLSRGRSYARSGQVTKLDVGTGGVDARVQGSRPTPYRVTIRFRRLSEAEWAAVAEAMAAEALYAARLLSGEMPDEIETAFEAAGATLFPGTSDDLLTDCTCPDWANPCKHVAAVFYLLGERFDDDPFLMFALRGRTKDEIIAALRALRAGTSVADAGEAYRPGADAASDEGAEPDDVAALQLDEDAAPLLVPAGTATASSPGSPAESFWTAPTSLDDLAIRFEPPAVDALPVKRLGPPPSWPAGRDFTQAAEQAYHAIGERARRLALEGT